jgi:protein-disulfide isomerase
MSLNAKRAVLVALSLALGACVTRGEVEELKSNQKKILDKLDALSRSGVAQHAAPQRPRGPDPAKVYSFPIDNSPVKGPADAWVTIVESSDFQCPFCKRVTDTLKEIEQKYGNEVRLVYKFNPLPFHSRAMPAAMAAACANEQGKFWKMHDLLFANQTKLDDASLESYAKQAGVDLKRWKTCYTTNKMKGEIDADMAKAAQLGARGTPAFFINGRFLSGAQPFASFQTLIDEELKKAKDSGVSKREYYAKQVVEKGEKAM